MCNADLMPRCIHPNSPECSTYFSHIPSRFDAALPRLQLPVGHLDLHRAEPLPPQHELPAARPLHLPRIPRHGLPLRQRLQRRRANVIHRGGLPTHETVAAPLQVLPRQLPSYRQRHLLLPVAPFAPVAPVAQPTAPAPVLIALSPPDHIRFALARRQRRVLLRRLRARGRFLYARAPHARLRGAQRTVRLWHRRCAGSFRVPLPAARPRTGLFPRFSL